jgi:hypothetical protein
MAVLDGTNRFRLWAHAMRNWPGTMPALTKADLRAAVDAADDLLEANQASFNAGLPQPFRGATTPAQKTFLIGLVAMRRASLLRTQED